MAAKQNVKRRIVDAAWELFYEKGYDDTTVDDIIRLSETSKGSFYYYFSSKDSLLDTLSTILDENYAKLEEELDPEMNSFDKLMYLNYRREKSIQEITKYYSLCERALVSDWCLNRGNYSLGEYSKEYMPVLMEHFRVNEAE